MSTHSALSSLFPINAQSKTAWIAFPLFASGTFFSLYHVQVQLYSAVVLSVSSDAAVLSASVSSVVSWALSEAAASSLACTAR